MKVGVSTSVLADKANFAELLQSRPQIVEFYTYPADSLPEIAGFCARNGIIPALHTPTPHPTRMKRYCSTGPDPDEATAAMDVLETTVRCAAELSAQHVVVHFPTPYPPFSEEAFNRFAGPFLDHASKLVREHGVPVLIENMTPNPYCATAEQYAGVLDRWPDLGMCLDIGHACLLGGAEAVLDFAGLVGERIRSVHLYDTDPAVAGHRVYPPPGVRAPAVPHDVMAHVIRTCRPEAVLLEHEPSAEAVLDRATSDWLTAVGTGEKGP